MLLFPVTWSLGLCCDPSTLRCVLISCESSRGPGTSFPFALTLVGLLCGPEKRKAVSGPMVFPSGIDW